MEAPLVKHNVNILLACMPKSGSTFLSSLIAELPQMRREHIVPGYQRREQEIERALIEQANQRTGYLRKLAVNDRLADNTFPFGWIAQHHTRYSEYTGKIIKRYDLKTVVLLRNIFDIVVSLHDHLNKSSQYLSMAFVPDGQPYDDATLNDFIADMVVPWYFNFYVSWLQRPDIPKVTYEALVNAPETVVADLFDSWGATLSSQEIEQALQRTAERPTRKNQAVAGRGQSLPDPVKDKIRSYTRFYPDVDFSPIGLA